MSWSKLLFIWNFEETTDRKAGFLLYPLVYFCQGHVRYMLPIENNLLLYDALLLNGHPLLTVRFLVIFCCCVLLAGDVRFFMSPNSTRRVVHATFARWRVTRAWWPMPKCYIVAQCMSLKMSHRLIYEGCQWAHLFVCKKMPAHVLVRHSSSSFCVHLNGCCVV